MINTENANELKVRLSALSPAKRAWLEQRLRKSLKKAPIGESAAVVQLQVGSGELPVYFINSGPIEICLAQKIGAGHSIFAIEMPWPVSWHDAAANNETAALPTMEQMVAPFVAALSTHVGSSPCVLAGYSFGGVMAFEAARQLQRLGGTVEMVMLLDTGVNRNAPLYRARGKLRQGWKHTLNEMRAQRSVDLIDSPLGAWLTFWSILVNGTKRILRFLSRLSSELRSLTSLEQSVLLQLKVLKSYKLRVLDCHGVLFRADAIGEKYPREGDGSLGWKGLFGKGLEIIPMTGNHVSMVQDEMHRLTLARKVTEVIGRYSISKDSTQSVGGHMVRSRSDGRNGSFRGGAFALAEDE
jgi:thioesterase domain-containing protein